MTTHVGLLRAVNIGPHNKVDMAHLRDLATGLGLRDARTWLQSGNVVFQSEGRTPAQLEQLLEGAAAKRLGFDIEFFVRTAKDWHALMTDNPFPKEAKADPSHLLVVLLKDTPDAEHAKALQKAITGREVVRVKGRCAYVVYPDGIGRSRLTSAVIEKKLGTRGTGRNWNTVLKLGTLTG